MPVSSQSGLPRNDIRDEIMPSVLSARSATAEKAHRSLAMLRWVTAAVVVTVAHGVGAWVLLNWKTSPAEAAAGAPEPAIMIELAAVSIAAEAPAEPLPPAPEKVEPEPTPPEPVKETPPPEPEPPPPDPVTETPVEPPPEVEPTPVNTPEPEIKLPDLPNIPKADAMLTVAPPPPEKPKEIVKPVERKLPPKKPRIVEHKPVEKPVRRQAAAPPPSQQASAPNPVSPGAAATPMISTASWRGSLIAHLNRYKRFPGNASPGTVQVAFSIDRGGRVISARLSGSSGDTALDEEAVSMVRRASPVPAPPDGLGGGVIALAVPVRFSR